MADRYAVIDGGLSDESNRAAEQPFGLHPVRILDPHQIPHRQWIYGTDLIRGFVSLLIAPGGTGKSSLLLATCLSIATGRSLLGPRIFQQCNTALLNLEDPEDEINRRITALSMRYKISNAEIGGRFFVSPPDRGVRIAANGADGFTIVHPDKEEIIRKVKEENIGVLAVDPFAESHTLEENSNPQMIQAAAAWRQIARECNCAVFLTHHVRKGPVDSIEAARGAKALTDSARIGMLLSTMTNDEAESLGISETDRLQYVRLDDAKANMAPRAPKARWFHLGNITLDNADATYTHGDQVVVVEPWQPPDDVIAKAPSAELVPVLTAIREGPEPGVRYTRSRRGNSGRWCGQVLCDAFQVADKQAAKTIDMWFRSGLLFETEYDHPKWRRRTKGVAVRDHDWPS